MALFKLDWRLWGKSDLLVHQVIDMGLELPLIFKCRNFACKVDLAVDIFKPLEPHCRFPNLFLHDFLKQLLWKVKVIWVKFIVLVPAYGAVVGSAVKHCVEIAKPKVHILVEILVVKSLFKPAFFLELFDMTFDLHLDCDGLLQGNFDAVHQNGIRAVVYLRDGKEQSEPGMTGFFLELLNALLKINQKFFFKVQIFNEQVVPI